MKNILFFLLIIFSSISYAAFEIRMEFPQTKIRQGTIQKVELTFTDDFAQKSEIQKIKGQKLGTAFYLYSLGPLMKKNGEDNLSTLAKIIVISEPKGSVEQAKFNDQDVALKWNFINFEKIDTPPKFLAANFSIPAITNFGMYFIVALFLLFTGVGAYMVRKKILLKKKIENDKKNIVKNMLGASDYNEIVEVWKNKSTPLKLFPKLDKAFKNLEVVLFKYQFKAEQSEIEKNEVVSAYSEFCSSAKEVIDGI